MNNTNLRNKVNQLNNKQSGVALFVALILLLALTIIGLSASQRANLQERMAANMHTDKMVFSAAESAIGAFLIEANTDDKLKSDHVLYKLRIEGSIGNNQYDKDGNRVEAGYIDSDLSGGSLVATITPTITEPCSKTCGGYSFGSDIGCRYYELEGKGELMKGGELIKSATTVMWAQEITTCN